MFGIHGVGGKPGSRGSGGSGDAPAEGGANGSGEGGGPGGAGGTSNGGSVAFGDDAAAPGADVGLAAGGDGEGLGGAGVGGAKHGDAGCNDPAGFHGVGCYTCPPAGIVTLESACSSAGCTPFDNARLSNLPKSGKLPPLPAPSAAGGASGSGGAPGSGGSPGAGGGSGGRVGVACDGLSKRGKIVYVTGSTAAKPFLQQIARQVAGQGVFIVYSSTGSCIGVDAIVNGTAMMTGPSPAPAASATYWDTSSSAGTACDLPLSGVAADLGISDVFAQSCPGLELAALDALQIRDAHGPIQTMTFAVPTNSAFTEISAQAAYFVFGFGKDGGVLDAAGGAPIWNDESFLYKRSASSGTQAMLAAAIGVDSALWKGKSNKSSTDVSASIQAAGGSKETADKAVGILAADYIDTENLRAQIRVLAYQDSSQRCAVFPDSTATAHDKLNVRDGHYPLWGPLHLLYKVDQLGNPLNPGSRQAVTDIVGFLSGTKPLPNGVELIDVYAQSGLVPECAMHVTRTKDGGNITPRRPETPCSCLFEAKATGQTACTPCRVQGDCAGDEACSQGYCEP